VASVLEFLQNRFSAGLTPSTLKVYVAAIAAFHAPLSDGPLGMNHLVLLGPGSGSWRAGWGPLQTIGVGQGQEPFI